MPTITVLVTIEVNVPVFSDQTSDLVCLNENHPSSHDQRNARPISGFTGLVCDALDCCDSPGKSCEIRRAIEREVSDKTFAIGGLTELPSPNGDSNHSAATLDPFSDGLLTLDQIEAEHIRRIRDSTTTLEDAAKTLGINPSTL